MRKSLAGVAFALVLTLGVAPVLASRPTIEYLDFSGGPFTLTGVCPFGIYEEPTGNKEKVATFYNQTGDITFQVITGVNKWRFTNVSTGKVLDVNASGPGRLFVEPGSDLVLAETGGVSFFFIPNPPPGMPTFSLTRGRVVAELDPTTFIVTNLVAQQGTVQDICALLR